MDAGNMAEKRIQSSWGLLFDIPRALRRAEFELRVIFQVDILRGTHIWAFINNNILKRLSNAVGCSIFHFSAIIYPLSALASTRRKFELLQLNFY
jgi:hypothetical protein